MTSKEFPSGSAAASTKQRLREAPKLVAGVSMAVALKFSRGLA